MTKRERDDTDLTLATCACCGCGFEPQELRDGECRECRSHDEVSGE